MSATKLHGWWVWGCTHTQMAFWLIKANRKQGGKKENTFVLRLRVRVSDKRGMRQRKWQGWLEQALLAVWVAHLLLSPHFLPGRHTKKLKISTKARLVEKWFGRIQDYHGPWNDIYIKKTFEVHYRFFLSWLDRFLDKIPHWQHTITANNER